MIILMLFNLLHSFQLQNWEMVWSGMVWSGDMAMMSSHMAH